MNNRHSASHLNRQVARLLAALLLLAVTASAQTRSVTRFPADKAAGVNPDTHLVLTFPSTPMLGTSGQIRIYDAASDRLVDTLDLSIPPGPTTSAAGGPVTYTPTPYEYVPGRFTNANTVAGTLTRTERLVGSTELTSEGGDGQSELTVVAKS